MPPLVSAIMPTRGRHQWVPQAVHAFLDQTWTDKELIILDDHLLPSFAIPPTLPGVSYMRQPRELTIGAKRNICCQLARGAFVMHWDDDDWSAPERMRDQVERLLAGPHTVTGYRRILLVDEAGKVVEYRGSASYAVGTSLAYARTWWERHRFPDLQIEEDNVFVREAVAAQKLISVDGRAMMVGRIHTGNTSPSYVRNGAFWPAPVDALPEGFHYESRAAQ